MSVVHELRQRQARALEALDAGDLEGCRRELSGAPSPQAPKPSTSIYAVDKFRTGFDRACRGFGLPSAAVAIEALGQEAGKVRFHFAGHPQIVQLLRGALVVNERVSMTATAPPDPYPQSEGIT